MKAAQQAMDMRVDYIKTMKPDKSDLIYLGDANSYDEELKDLIFKHTLRRKIITFIDDGKFEYIESRNIDALCKNIGLSIDRTAALIMDSSYALPHYCKKVREIISAEGALLFLYLSHSENAQIMIRHLSPDYIVIEHEQKWYLDYHKNT